ncbi:F0F1 ATP synthase subunit gamma [Pseudomonas sp. SA3-5]|uniref:F0F1 ATP synthase subunit gamma n=1 Tax=Pseudomonas aestuarii TaxID=3018340 RepID=A0ABT4XLI7_9PSED|nr:F0F1 ATP synthase subunit gamma [Pseudomonas aestuarii]MDA7089045.1 F0F1 ATP synthase subunit gamma [Pseudomonas aestuarii]
MSDTSASLRRSIASAGDLQSVVRSMKALAGASIGQYEQSVLALAEYYRSVELGLSLCLRQPQARRAIEPAPAAKDAIGAIVFGSDQGLVGQFNERVAEFAIQALADIPGDLQVWAVGERVHGCLEQAGLPLKGLFRVPSSVKGIAPLVGQIQLDSEAHLTNERARFYVFHNRPQVGMSYAPVSQRLLPLDRQWQQDLAHISWPSGALPEILHDAGQTLRALIREYLFISLFRACAESLASENASRLAAMQRADKNIEELLEQLHSDFNRLRQSSIDAELFEVISGYESLTSR